MKLSSSEDRSPVSRAMRTSNLNGVLTPASLNEYEAISSGLSPPLYFRLFDTINRSAQMGKNRTKKRQVWMIKIFDQTSIHEVVWCVYLHETKKMKERTATQVESNWSQKRRWKNGVMDRRGRVKFLFTCFTSLTVQVISTKNTPSTHKSEREREANSRMHSIERRIIFVFIFTIGFSFQRRNSIAMEDFTENWKEQNERRNVCAGELAIFPGSTFLAGVTIIMIIRNFIALENVHEVVLVVRF